MQVFENMKWLFEILKELADKKWYGKLEISMESGAVTLVRRIETLKPPKE
jgi:hypothetical protein